MERRFLHRETVYRVEVGDAGRLTVIRGDDDPVTVAVRRIPGGVLVVDGVDGPGGAAAGYAAGDGDTVWVRWQGRTYRMRRDRGRRRGGSAAGGLAAPMPGQVIRHLVEPGTVVESGTALVVLEAMKMQLEIKAPVRGRVARFLAAAGDTVAEGTELVELEETGTAP